ncbi:glycyl-radical enzyme activating protein [Candidatus Bathyarchaeota archaeon]|nr:glycyl-radical enzyme activating protein [Candidatus Bathyarchaeota archaeon]MBL7080417.1 glycyl-radical enzyme activating protein [Candidatus Bathyarchaeota archaeon]
MQAESGIVFDVKHFAVHDGPGIRTTIFLKGCPLRCLWCHSPESQSPRPEVAYYPNLCIGCGACVEACPNGAQTLGTPKILRELCTGVGRCAEECYAGATIIHGREASVEEVLEEVDKDRLLYETSGGGVTLSGGEPTMQPGFASALLGALKERGYNTALDTCGHAEWKVLEHVITDADLVLYDLKHMDPLTHRELTGVTAELIQSNLRRVSESGKALVVRVPVVPGHNDSPENFTAMADYLGGLEGVEAVELLPYHNLGAPKYMALGREYPLEGLRSPEPGELRELGSLLEAEGLRVVIEGLE